MGYPPEQAQQALLADDLDAALIVTGWDSPVVQSLARAPGIQLLGFPRADAYVALFPFLNKLVLPRGVADLAADRPPQDTPLIASKASLAVRSEVHPALQFPAAPGGDGGALAVRACSSALCDERGRWAEAVAGYVREVRIYWRGGFGKGPPRKARTEGPGRDRPSMGVASNGNHTKRAAASAR